VSKGSCGGSPRAHDSDGPLRWSREARSFPAAVATRSASGSDGDSVAQGVGYEGRQSEQRFGHPSVTNSSDPVVSTASFSVDILQSFVYACDGWLRLY
jgi:hypothetical protein